jgi:pimeloyl-ACP methyl ester carboxylesterase
MKLEIISKQPSSGNGHSPLLFIHGMLHGAWCWDAHFLDYFAQHGYPAYAVNLRGHGNSEGRERLRWTRIADFADDVACAVAQLPCSPVLVGHSMGGFIIQKYLQEATAPGAVLLSSPSPKGLIGTALGMAGRHPMLFAKMNATFSLLPLISTPQLAREAFLSADLPEDQLMAYWARMEEESYAALLDMVALDLPDPARVKTPLLVLGVERDNMLRRSDIEATARAYNTQFQIVPGVAHDSMIELQWENVAGRILGWLHEREL